MRENKHYVVKESNHIFFGIDNMAGMMNNYPRNDAEEFIQYELFDIWEFPQDVGCQNHTEIDEEDE